MMAMPDNENEVIMYDLTCNVFSRIRLTKEGKLSYMRIYYNKTPTNYKIPKFYVTFVEKIANQLVD